MFRFDSWAVSDAIIRVVEGIHIGFIRHITGKRAHRQDKQDLGDTRDGGGTTGGRDEVGSQVRWSP